MGIGMEGEGANGSKPVASGLWTSMERGREKGLKSGVSMRACLS